MAIEEKVFLTRDGLITFLKENLQLEVRTESVYVGYGDEIYRNVHTLVLKLGDEEISEVDFD